MQNLENPPIHHQNAMFLDAAGHTEETGEMGPIAIFADFFAEQYQTSVIRACMSQIRLKGRTSTVLSGGHINLEGALLQKGNAVFDLAQNGFDGGIILGGSLSALTSTADVANFFSSRFDYPLVSISAPLPGIPSVMVDNYRGMRMVAEHLVRKHHYRNFAFFRKQEGHFEAEERLRAFRDVLDQVGTPLRREATIPGRFYMHHEEGLAWLLDEQGLVPGKDLDVLVCADTWTLMNILPFLEARGIRVPEDLALASFDHAFEHSMPFEPTCATQPLDHMAKMAVDLLFRSMAGQEVPLLCNVTPRFINGTSCGCPDPLVSFGPTHQSQGCRDELPLLPMPLSEALELALAVNGEEESDEEELRALVHQDDTLPFDPHLGDADHIPILSSKPKDLEPPESIREYIFNADRLRLAEIRFRNLGRLGLRLKDDSTDHARARTSIGSSLRSCWEEILRLKIEISLKRRETDRKIRETLAYAYLSSHMEDLIWQFFGYLQYLLIPNAEVHLYHPKDGSVCLGGTMKAGIIKSPLPEIQPMDTQGRLAGFAASTQGVEALVAMPLIYEKHYYGNLIIQLPRTYWEDFYVFDTLRLVLGGSIHGAMLMESSQKAEDAVRQARERMLQSEKYVLLGSLVAGISHEVNNPLGVALTAASMLEHDLDQFFSDLAEGRISRSELEEHRKDTGQITRMILSACQRAADLMTGFKQLSVDQSSDRIRRFSFASCLDDVILSMRPSLKTKHVEIKTTIPLVLELETQAGALSQILTNCIMNSLTHAFGSGKGGTIWIEASGKSSSSFALDYRDDGKGIPAEELPRHFEPFFTTQRDSGGSGLGTHIIHSLVTDRFGGTITLQSSPGQGLHYHIEIPDNPHFRILLG